ncbi:Thymidylate kinase [Hyphomicrobiales bacterium]|nr:Thymidylate kinase [Hyphomicrobiales bacterium]CAH1702608.1 Thymidylate kinase [Hyphomicrobiales bacterium]CAI0346811.1 Thymidylate kinase [Hyphomicrobiales bacterium]
MAGFFVSMEGVDGSGKSGMARRLGDWLREKSIAVVSTREPGGSTGAERIRELLLGSGGILDPLAEALLFAAARADHVRKLIVPTLEAGGVVISDRFSDSTIAYQGAGSTVDMTVIHQLQEIAVGEHRPDLVIILDVDPSISMERARKRNGDVGVKDDRFEAEGLAFHARVREGFLRQAATDRGRYVVIDASRSPDEVWGDVLEAFLAAAMNKGLDLASDHAPEPSPR